MGYQLYSLEVPNGGRKQTQAPQESFQILMGMLRWALQLHCKVEERGSSGNHHTGCFPRGWLCSTKHIRWDVPKLKTLANLRHYQLTENQSSLVLEGRQRCMVESTKELQRTGFQDWVSIGCPYCHPHHAILYHRGAHCICEYKRKSQHG